ncbi:transcriptional regulator, AraC family [Marvinbryantia formatexigens DSM 14469]|uniref:Transcriptional regulator, AraC family n=2 Tax=Marvinbryantia TaxID=248744 RepID=C6LAX2_9FIRM|nr:transcriptional regulator, AraC family [Marvinbryantia formatexigens DSM 14469]
MLYAEKRLFEMNLSEDNTALAGTLISLMLCRLLPVLTLTEYQKLPTGELPTDILTYIANHYREDISLSSVAAQFGTGKFVLSRIFSNVLGVSFTDYVNSLRLSHAQHLLASTDRNILDIALECGYHNQQTFNRVFKARFSCTPKEFRKSHPGHIEVPLECFFTGETG